MKTLPRNGVFLQGYSYPRNVRYRYERFTGLKELSGTGNTRVNNRQNNKPYAANHNLENIACKVDERLASIQTSAVEFTDGKSPSQCY